MGRKAFLKFSHDQRKLLSDNFFRKLKDNNCEHLTDVQIAKAIGFKHGGMIGYLRNEDRLDRVSSVLLQILNTLPTSKFEEMSEIESYNFKRTGPKKERQTHNKGSEFFRGQALRADRIKK